jgi:hypothetical protein
MQMAEPTSASTVICFVDGTQTILHPPQFGCPACESGLASEELEAGVIMHKLPGGFLLPIPPQIELDDYVVFLRDHLLRMDDSLPTGAIEFTTATFCEFSENPTDNNYTPNEERFPLNPDGQVNITVNNYMLIGWLTHIFTYDFDSGDDILEE